MRREQQIAEIGNPDEVPLDIAILFDISSSVSQKGFFAVRGQAGMPVLLLLRVVALTGANAKFRMSGQRNCDTAK